jgi:hypothetical protein
MLRRKHQGETLPGDICPIGFFTGRSLLPLHSSQARSPRKLLRREFACCRILHQARAQTFEGQTSN